MIPIPGTARPIPPLQGEKIPAHSQVLCARSQVLERQLYSGMKDTDPQVRLACLESFFTDNRVDDKLGLLCNWLTAISAFVAAKRTCVATICIACVEVMPISCFTFCARNCMQRRCHFSSCQPYYVPCSVNLVCTQGSLGQI